MPVIKRLPPEVFSAIAAGEVVERPASALKELIENSLDAGARSIAVEAAGAGRKLLRVRDDGCGMDKEDCASALERHATSKLSAIDDLERLSTYGFRGEALFAVAAVSRLTLQSAPARAKTGWAVAAEGGRIVSSKPAPASPGTTVEARDLFFNTPARLKFLKSDAHEKGALAAAVEEAALANPGVRFTYKSESRTVLNFPALAEKDPLAALRLRVAAVLGREISEGLIPVVMDRPGMRLSMLVSSPEAMAATRSYQYWFVNRRPVSARTLQTALYRAFAEHRGHNPRHPVCVAALELSPDSFDVNVHPGKREIRFKSEREVHELVAGLITAALAKNRGPVPLIREPRGSFVRETPAAYLEADAPLLALENRPAAALAAPADGPRWFNPPYRYLGQIEKSYLVFEAAGGVFILDQHAAAERILFERYLDGLISGKPKVQKLLLPISLEFPASRLTALLGRADRLRTLGFSVEAFGKTTLRVTAAPAAFGKAGEVKDVVARLLDYLQTPEGSAQDVSRDAAATIACKAAVKAHDRLGEKEALALLEELKDCKDGSCCPHGRRSMLALNRDELARRFQRPGAVPL